MNFLSFLDDAFEIIIDFNKIRYNIKRKINIQNLKNVTMKY